MCKQKVPVAKKGFNESYVHTSSVPMGKLICFYKNMQSDILNLCLLKHFFQVNLKVHCLKWQGNVYNKSIKIKAMLLAISLSFVDCFEE